MQPWSNAISSIFWSHCVAIALQLKSRRSGSRPMPVFDLVSVHEQFWKLPFSYQNAHNNKIIANIKTCAEKARNLAYLPSSDQPPTWKRNNLAQILLLHMRRKHFQFQECRWLVIFRKQEKFHFRKLLRNQEFTEKNSGKFPPDSCFRFRWGK